MLQKIPKLNSICLRCVANDRIGQFPEDASEEDKLAYMRAVFQELSKIDNQHGPTIATRNIYDLQKKMFGYHESYLELRTRFNKLMMEKEPEIRKTIQQSQDSLQTAIQYAIAGNYIDFMIMKNVDDDTLNSLLQEAPNYKINREVLESLREDIGRAKRLTYLTDNCGEIVLDKLLIEQIRKINPELQVTAIVRGEEILNDATMEDAIQIGLLDVANVIGNGDSLAGTCLYRISDEAKRELENADVVISKGQGNLEMLQGCNMNLYHIFLCKCEMFSSMFQVPKFTPMLVKENLYWKDYIREFNDNDEELYINDIPNAQALEFLEAQIPIVDLSDKVIERAYYFRWWAYRKHIKTTQEGHVITEFLPTVPWSTTYNAISCPAGFHIREGRWLKDEEGIIKDYIRFWLTFPEKMYSYSSWLAAAVVEYCEIHGDWTFAEEIFDDLEVYFQKRIERSKKDIGLFYSEDCEDGMEISISGNGLRPTASSYAYADAMALSRLAKRKGLQDKARQYETMAEGIKEKMMTLLWNGDFFQTIPEECMTDPCLYEGIRPMVAPEKSVRELIGYVPWYFGIPEVEKTEAFQKLLDPKTFYSPYGLTVAEQSHPRFMEPHRHECLWNGPIWPFATTQVLVALANAVRDCKDAPQDSQTTGVYRPCKDDYYKLLHQYAASFQRTLPSGKIVDWIDENMDPENGEWLARRILEGWGFKESAGGYERGKDYNHSMYCDLVLSGLLGIQGGADGELEVVPLIPDDWEYFRVQNLHFRGRRYEIVFDKDGTHYGEGKGLHIKNIV